MPEKLTDVAVDFENIWDISLTTERVTKLEFYVQNLAKFLEPPFTFALPENLIPPENPSEDELTEYRRRVAKETTQYQLFRPNNQFQFFIFLSGLLDDKLIVFTEYQRILIKGYVCIIQAKAIEDGRTLRTVKQMECIKDSLERIVAILRSMLEQAKAA